MKETHRPKQNSNYYSNIVVFSQDNEFLSTIGERRMKWYLKKDLATKVDPPEGFLGAIQLKFKNKDKDKIIAPWEKQFLFNRCVVCGKENNLTMHHVIPWVIRKHFLEKDKANKRNWCVLLCVKHHNEVENKIKSIYNIPVNPLVSSKKVNRNKVILISLKSKNKLHTLPRERLEQLLILSGYKTINEIPVREKHYMSKTHKNFLAIWVKKFINENGGIDGVKKLFRESFMSLEPKFLPKNYLE